MGGWRGNERRERLPALQELGVDLMRISPLRKLISLALPFVWCGAYFALTAWGWWIPAVFALMALSFVTYGSTSHDLVHRNLGLHSNVNEVLLSLIELLALRSGHAYRAAHLHHHARFPLPDDIEAIAARRSLIGALGEGVVFQLRVWLWAVRHASRARAWVIGEGMVCLLLAGTGLALWRVSIAATIYVVLMVLGSWIIPLVTSYVPHNSDGEDELAQTRAFRGVVASVVALEHLYHLEHHLYPSVPHHNWPRLAKHLDPYLERAGVQPIRLWF